MSQLTYAELISFVRIVIPDVPQAKIGTAANLVLEDVYERLNQVGYSTFTTRAPTTSGTVSVTNNSTAVTFSGSAMSASDTLRIVQIGDDATFYVLTRTTDSTGTLSSKYAGTTNTTASYRICYPTVTFPAAVGQILEIKRASDAPLDFMPGIDPETIVTAGTLGAPRYFGPYAFDGSATPDDAYRAILRPFPNAIYAFAYQYTERPTLIDPAAASPGSVKIPIPTSFRRAMQFGTVALCQLAQDQESSDRWTLKAEDELRKALAYTGTSASGSQRQGVHGPRHAFHAIQYPPS